MDESNNCLEILLNLIYLARHSASDADAVAAYLAEAETQALRLAVLHGGRTPSEARRKTSRADVDNE